MSDQKKKTVVIVGLGFAGMRVFNVLQARQDVILVAIDAKDYFFNVPAAVPALTDAGNAEYYLQEISKNSALKAVFKQGYVTGVSSDGTAGTVTLASGETVPFDFLILAIGCSYGAVNPPITGLLTKTERLAVLEAQRAAVTATDTVVIVGGGAVGVEVVAGIAETFPGKKITLIASGNRVLDRLDEAASTHAAAWLAAHGVTVVTGQRVTNWGGVGDEPVQGTVVTDTGDSYAGLVYKCVGGRAAAVGGVPTVASGRVAVGPTLQVKGMPNVLAAGDVADTSEEKTANFADYAGAAAAATVVALIEGQEPPTFPEGIFKGLKKLPFTNGATLGARDGVMQMGGEVTTGRAVGVIHAILGKLIMGSAAGSWLWSRLYSMMKGAFVGQIVGAAKKEEKAAAVAAAS